MRHWAWALTVVILWGGAFAASAAPTFDEAMKLFEANQHAQAREAIEAFVAAHPDDPRVDEIRFRYVKTYFRAHDYKGFDKAAQAFLKTNPAIGWRHKIVYNYAQLPYRKHRWAEGIVALEKFMAETPNFAHLDRPARDRAICMFHLGDDDGFNQALAEFKIKYPQSHILPTLDHYRALVSWRNQDWNGAEARLRLHLKTYPDWKDRAVIERLLADCLGKQGRWDEARAIYDKLWTDKADKEKSADKPTTTSAQPPKR